MKSNAYIVFSIYLTSLSLVFFVLSLCFQLKYCFVVFLVLLILGIIMILSWSFKRYTWVCDKCGKEFKVPIKQYMWDYQGGVNYKKVFCPQCKKLTYCSGVKKR